MTVTTRVQLQPAYVLHGRPFQESSLLLEVWAREHGRLPLVARGGRRARSPVRAILQPFVPLLLSWVGRGEVCTLTGVERSGPWMPLTGSGVACGFYLNELLLRLLPRNDSHEQLFERYAHALEALGGTLGTQRILRMFERDLLQELGYALVLERDAESGEPIAEEGLYHYDPQRGPVRVREGPSGGIVVRGRSLISLLSGDLSDADSLREAKRLLRAALTPHLGPRPLRSRSLLHGPDHVEA